MTTVAITAIPRASAIAAAISITVTGAASGETLTVNRRVGSAALAPVMGASAVAAASMVLVDPEAPLNKAASWVVTTSTGATAESGQVTITGELATIADPVLGQVAECAVIDRDELQRTPRADVLQVEGDDQLWVVWDVPVGRTMPVSVITLTSDDFSALEAVLSTGDPILLRCVCGNHTDRWIQPVSDKTSSAPIVKRSASQLRTWSLGDCVVYSSNPRLDSRAKAGTLGEIDAAVSPKTLGAIAARWATLGAIAIADLAES